MHLRLNAAGWLRAHAVVLAALALVCAQVGWTVALLAHSYFRQDDYLILDRARLRGFTWSYLMSVDPGGHGGHLMPIGQAIAWLLARASPYDWRLAGVVITVLVAAASLAVTRMLLTLFGARPAILVPLAVYLFGPLSVGAVAWWSAGLEVLPLELAIASAVHAHVRYLRERRPRQAVAAACALLVGMAAADQGALVPPLLLAVTAGYFAPGRWTEAVRLVLRRYWRAWLLYGALLAAYCAVFFFQLVTSGIRPAGPGLATRLYAFAGTLIGKTALPGAIGGPWRWLASGYAQASPPAVLEYLSWAVAAVVVAVSCLYRVRAWRAWVILLGWIVAADIVPAAIGGFGALPVSSLADQTGYLADATPVLALCLGLAFLPVADPQPGLAPRQVPRPVRAVTLVAFCAFAAGAVVSLPAFAAANPVGAARSYIATARLAVRTAPRGTVIVTGPTPATIMNPDFFPPPQGYTSQVIGVLADGTRAERWTATLDGVIADPMTFDTRGQLRPVAVEGPSAVPAPGRTCWDVTAAGASIPLDGWLYRWAWTARLSYSGPGGRLAVSFGGTPDQVTLPPGTHVAYVPVVGSGSTVSVRFAAAAPGALCLTGVTVGSLHPDQAGPAIPAAPVPG